MMTSTQFLDDLDAAQAAIDAKNRKNFDTLAGLVAEACQYPGRISTQLVLDRIPEGFTLADLRAAVEARLVCES